MAALETNEFAAWYTASENANSTISVESIFNEALAEFSSEFSKDGKQSEWVNDSTCGNFESVLASIEEARVHYEERKDKSNVRKGLVQLSKKLYNYSSIMDLLLSQQPKYSALAWGAMKCVLMTVMDHENLLSQLCEGLNGVAHIISSTELNVLLYPTQQIKQIVYEIYSHILEFLLRVLRWYRESKITHVRQALTKSVEHRYGDLLATISSLFDTMSKVVLDSSHAEQRDMHRCITQIMHEQKLARESITELKTEQKLTRDNITELTTAVSDMKLSMVTEQSINASARIEIRQKLSEVQLLQLLDQLSVSGLPEPIKAFQLLLFMSKKRQPKSSTKGAAFWLDTKIQKWNKSKDSSLVIINGTWKTRVDLQNFCAESIAILLDAKCPVIWVLKALNVDRTPTDQAQVSTIDLLKYIISQAVLVNKNIHTDAALIPRLMAYLDAKSEDDLMNILASILQGIPRLYIIIDVEVLGQNLGTLTEDFWPAAFLRMFSELSTRSIGTIVKVVLISYGSPLLKGPFIKDCQDLVVSVGGGRQTRASAARARNQRSSVIRTRRKAGLKAMYN